MGEGGGRTGRGATGGVSEADSSGGVTEGVSRASVVSEGAGGRGGRLIRTVSPLWPVEGKVIRTVSFFGSFGSAIRACERAGKNC